MCALGFLLRSACACACACSMMRQSAQRLAGGVAWPACTLHPPAGTAPPALQMDTGEQPYAGEQPFRVSSRVAAGPLCLLELPPSAPAGFRVRRCWACGGPAHHLSALAGTLGNPAEAAWASAWQLHRRAYAETTCAPAPSAGLVRELRELRPPGAPQLPAGAPCVGAGRSGAAQQYVTGQARQALLRHAPRRRLPPHACPLPAPPPTGRSWTCWLLWSRPQRQRPHRRCPPPSAQGRASCTAPRSPLTGPGR